VGVRAGVQPGRPLARHRRKGRRGPPLPGGRRGPGQGPRARHRHALRSASADPAVQPAW
jgi:hypothetical protein